MQKLRAFPRWLDALYVLCLALYMLAGASSVPFHGDESTVIYTARDFYYIAVQGDMRHVLYSNQPERISPDAAAEQHLRLLNGTVSRYLYGLAAYSAGYRFEQLNGQWDWCCDLAYNGQTGHIPPEDLLLRTRLVSTLLLVASMGVMFALSYQVSGRPAAYLASLVYAVNPALLINGRRAMMESGMMLFTLLVVLAGIWVIRQIQASGQDRLRPGGYVMLGMVAGLALASKHTAALTVIAVFAVCFTYALWRWWQTKHIGVLRHGLAITGAGILAFGVFYALNPAWWGNPAGRAGEVLRLRTELLNGQTATFGGYPDLGAQTAGFLRQVFMVLPQYYEVSNWQDFIGGQITAYEASPWHGISIGGSVPGAVVLALLVFVGFVTIVRNRTLLGGVRWLVSVYALAMLAVTLLLTPLEWQRYYLAAYPAVGLLAAAGTVTLANQLAHRITSTLKLNHHAS